MEGKRQEGKQGTLPLDTETEEGVQQPGRRAGAPHEHERTGRQWECRTGSMLARESDLV